MAEKREDDLFNEDDDGLEAADDLVIDHLLEDLDKQARAASRTRSNVRRRLERLAEMRRLREELSDYEDF